MLKDSRKIRPVVVADALSDTVARIRNSLSRKHKHTHVVRSRFVNAFLAVLQEEGYINGFEPFEGQPYLTKVHLKYVDGMPSIAQMKRVSTQGRRIYVGVQDIPKVRNGLGIAVLSTSAGMMSDAKALQNKVGGELLCTVF
jgi:small subunit ribosomal protein S8